MPPFLSTVEQNGTHFSKRTRNNKVIEERFNYCITSIVFKYFDKQSHII